MIKAKICCCCYDLLKRREIMDKKFRKSIKKEFQKVIKNITGASSEENEISRIKEQLADQMARLGNQSQSTSQITIPIQINAESISSTLLASKLPELALDSEIENSVLKSLAKKYDFLSKLDRSNSEKIVSAATDAFDPLEGLSMDFHSILQKEYFSDVSIKCGSDDLKAHKMVLCARSPVFEAMFTSNLKESEDGIVVIEDIDPDVLRDFLKFVYCGQLHDLTVPKACNLLYAAEKYQIQSLKQLCANYLRLNLSVENAFHILECASLFDAQLRSHTLDYISDHFSSIETSEEWEKLQIKSPSLALEVYSAVVKSLQGKN